LYRFYSGGTRIKVAAQVNNLNMRACLSETPGTNSYEDPVSQTAQFEQYSNINNMMELTIPYYSSTRCRAVSQEWTRPGRQVGISLDKAAPAQRIVGLGYEAAADDFSFFFMVGPPVMHIRTAVETLAVLPAPQ